MPSGRPAIIETQPAALEDAELVARLFRALGDASRLRILQLLLAEGEPHQAVIARRLGLSQARASEHLAWCGLVGVRVEGRRRLYRVADPRVAGLLSRARGLLRDNRTQLVSCRRIDPQAQEGDA